MKKLTSVLMIAALAGTFMFTGCDFNNDDGTGGQGGGGGGTEKHVYKADSIEVTPDKGKYVYYSSHYTMLSGDYTADDFKVCAHDSYYGSESYAEYDGYEAEWTANHIAETTVTVNDVVAENCEFTIETGKSYIIKFTYKPDSATTLESTLNVSGNCEGGIVESSKDISEIDGVILSELTSKDSGLNFDQIYVKRGTLTGDNMYSERVYAYNITSDDYSIFVGADENSLTAYSGALKDYVFRTADKMMKVYHETGLASPSDAKTLCCTVNMNVSPVSDIANVQATFNSVTKNTECSLLSVIKNDSVTHDKITCLNSSYETETYTDAEIGTMKILDADGNIKPEFTFEIYDNIDMTGTPVATINSSTTESDMWTPGTGAVLESYSTHKVDGIVNGVKTSITTYTKAASSNVYFVKVIYNDGESEFVNKPKNTTIDASDTNILPDGMTSITVSSLVSKITVKD